MRSKSPDAAGATYSETVTIQVNNRPEGVLVVDTTSDVADGDTSSIDALFDDRGGDGKISLREAILATNATANGAAPDEIHFEITDPLVGGAHTIVISAAGLPGISDAVIIDGTTDSDYAGTPIIELDGSSTSSYTPGLALLNSGSGSTVRGLAINRFAGDGIAISGSGNTIVDNFIGTDVTGTVDLGNKNSGVYITGSSNVIGGSAADRNVISGNTQRGVYIVGAAATGNVVPSNYIGTDVTGTVDLGNTWQGVLFTTSASGNVIGGTAADAGNLIAFNDKDGVALWSTAGNDNAILGNSIHSNTESGIDLNADDGITYNDADDVDSGPNELLNFPVLTNVVQNGADLDIDFDVDLPNGYYRVEFFDNTVLDPSGFGEGATYVGYANIAVTGAVGYKSYSITLSGVTASNVLNITATATEANATFTNYGSTSEFGPQFLGAGVLEVTTTSDVADGDTSSIAALLGNRGADGEISLREAILATNNTAGTDTIQFNIGAADAGHYYYTDDGVAGQVTLGNRAATTAANDGLLVNPDADYAKSWWSIALSSALPDITDAVVIDGSTQTGFTDSPIIELDGSGAGAGVDGLRLSTGSNGSIITALVVNQFASDAVEIRTDSNTVTAGYFGTDVSGTIDLGNTAYGISIMLGADDNIIGGAAAGEGNLLSGNGIYGVYIAGNAGASDLAERNVVQGNFIGTDITGTVDLGNTSAGLYLNYAANTQLGGSAGTLGTLGTAAFEGNLISGNNSFGVAIVNADSTDNKIQGNFIGTDITGTVDLGNGVHGVYIINGADNNLIGGSGVGEGNLISGNNSFGVYILGNTAGSDLTDGNVLQGNFIGTDITGTADLGNAQDGIYLHYATSTQIGGATGTITTLGSGAFAGNLISGNDSDGIAIFHADSTNNTIQGNYLGTDLTGTVDLGNTYHGVYITNGADNNTIGGSVAGAGNLISGNNASGIFIQGNGGTLDAADGNVVQGNFIGTNSTGNADLGNASNGIYLDYAINTQVGGATGTIGALGSGAFEGNLISGNADSGILIDNASNNVVQGNYVGTDVTGTADWGNGQYGISIAGGATNNQIGGTTATARNIISGNDFSGIVITGMGTDDNVVAGNYIGTDVTGTVALGNTFHGVNISTNAANNLIGGTAAGADNLIAHNTNDGVTITSTSNGNTVLGNTIHSNGDLGIDLNNDGATVNDADDVDTGANNLQNFPVITSATLSGTDLTLAGTLDTDGLSTQYRIEFYGNASGSEDGSGHGEGSVYLGVTTVTTDGSGDAMLSGVTLSGVTLAVGDTVTATATRIDDPAQVGIDDALAYGDTSEFSANFAITAPTINSVAVGVNDSLNTNEDTPLIIDAGANDTDADTDSISVVEFTQPTNGTVVDNGDGTLTYTPDADYFGADSFDYVAIDSGSGLQHYWGLDGDALDAIGGADGTVNGTTTVAGDFGDALSFDDAASDYVLLPDVSYASEFTISFEFKVDDNTGSLFQYMYSHGDINGTNSINIFLNEASHGTDPNVLRTVVRDANDTLDNFALQFDATSLIGTGWHTYTLTVGANGLEVFIDGGSKATDAIRGTDGVNPTGDLLLGKRDSLPTDRYYGGALDSLQIFDNALDVTQITDLVSNVNRATVNITVDPLNDAPTFDVGDAVVATAIGAGSDLGDTILVQPDGKFLVVGYSDNGSNMDVAVTRYNADGTLDTSFDGDGIVTTAIGAGEDRAHGATLQADGKIVVSGRTHNGSDWDFFLIRYNSDGTLDTSFDTDGIVTTDFGGSNDVARSVAVQANGKIVQVGNDGNDVAVVRYNSDGSLDTSFDTDGKVVTPVGVGFDYANDVVIQPDGKILVAGQSNNGSSTDFAVLRYNTDGSLDASFDGDGIVAISFGSVNDSASDIALQADGKIVVAGFSNNGADVDFAVARLNADGSLDTSFNTDGKVTTAIGSGDDYGNAVTLQTDGKILVAGRSHNGSDDDFAVVRYNTDGSPRHELQRQRHEDRSRERRQRQCQRRYRARRRYDPACRRYQ